MSNTVRYHFEKEKKNPLLNQFIGRKKRVYLSPSAQSRPLIFSRSSRDTHSSPDHSIPGEITQSWSIIPTGNHKSVIKCISSLPWPPPSSWPPPTCLAVWPLSTGISHRTRVIALCLATVASCIPRPPGGCSASSSRWSSRCRGSSRGRCPSRSRSRTQSTQERELFRQIALLIFVFKVHMKKSQFIYLSKARKKTTYISPNKKSYTLSRVKNNFRDFYQMHNLLFESNRFIDN